MSFDGMDTMMANKKAAVFEDLNGLNINGHTEKKNVNGKELTYLSWPWAWAEIKKRYPDARYTIWKNENGLPYTEDPLTGYMVYTSVTIEGITHEMWLPVMDGANKAMRRERYQYSTKYNGMKTCEAATMMDINKTIMRCLVKNLAMFGLGLYIYAGEDLPETEQDEQKQNTPTRPQKGPENGTVSTAGTIPQAKKEEPKQAEKQPESPGQFMQRRIAEMKQEYAALGFDFLGVRKALIDGGQVPDVPSATMTMEQAEQLMREIEFFYEEKKAAS